ncbi:MAG: bifunctional hydroxymethylpyrimidine kinase/phosphomethylpyrimidine kinase [Deltaproteobacteria bacterium GWA2_54_12]|nr:MAG: bifunctional hydroxymethylpyrimidine kinase/phosphomethylpyrimidine kinase [Deltaproteobacteria bacterium GWA2_54_12]
MMKTVLTIAGSDPSGGAGLQSDLRTFSAFNVKGLSAVTALTAQNSARVKSVMPVPGKLLKEQLELLFEEFTIDAAKTGMIGSLENLRVIKKVLKARPVKNLVIDTVLRSTGGKPLLDAAGAKELTSLLPLAAIVTPNIPEASALTGIKITNETGMEKAAKALFEMGARNVLVKGGHLGAAPTDLLYDGKTFTYFKGRRITGFDAAFHGTGCMLSAAIAAGLAKGKGMKEAIKEAKRFLEKELRQRVRA